VVSCLQDVCSKINKTVHLKRRLFALSGVVFSYI
jgi:hypothetical protein